MLNWNEGQQRSIVALVSRITRDAAAIDLLFDKMANQSREIRSTWNREQLCSSQGEDYVDDSTSSGKYIKLALTHYSSANTSAFLSSTFTLSRFPEFYIVTTFSQINTPGSTTSYRFPKTDWFASLENKVNHIIERQKNSRVSSDVKEAFKIPRRESQKKVQKQQQLPTKAVTDISSVDLWGIFGLR